MRGEVFRLNLTKGVARSALRISPVVDLMTTAFTEVSSRFDTRVFLDEVTFDESEFCNEQFCAHQCFLSPAVSRLKLHRWSKNWLLKRVIGIAGPIATLLLEGVACRRAI